MRYMWKHRGNILVVPAFLLLTAVLALSLLYSSSWPFQDGVVSAQSQDPPQITSLSDLTVSSITVNWEEADDTDVHWVYSVKADGTDGTFQMVNSEPPHSTAITGLEDNTEYWFAVIGVGSPSESSPSGWFSWSSWARATTIEIGEVTLGQDVSVAEGGTANFTVTSTVAPTSDLTVSYTIGTDDDEATVDGDGNDYSGSATGSIIISAGDTQGVIPIVINDDSDIDDGARETLVVTITIPEMPSQQLGERTSAAVVINEGVCDRTAELQTAILNSLYDISDCVEVTDADLNGINIFINLSGQGITELKARDLLGLTSLQILLLNNNSLTTIPEDVFDGLTSLGVLGLNGNSLTTIPEDVFDGLTSLEALGFKNNSLTTLPDDLFDGLTNLQSLALNNNSLTELPEDVFDGLTNLQFLYLHENSLAELPERLFSGITGLRTLPLDSNPGSPFTFTTEVEQTVADQVKVRVSHAVPFDLTVTLSVEGGTLSPSSVVVPAGSFQSPVVTVTPEGDDAVTVSTTAASFPTSGVITSGIQTGLSAANEAPTADAGSDQTVVLEEEVALDASGSTDPDTGDTLSYSWTQTAGTTVTLSDATESGPTFTATSSADDLTFQVTVMDGRGGSDRETVDIAVVSFAPQDITWSTPGTYTFNVGQANRVYISGRGADAGSGGQGGFRSESWIFKGTHTGDYPSSSERGSGGPGGTGNPGVNGVTGSLGQTLSHVSLHPLDRLVSGNGGGGGEAGEQPVDATISASGSNIFTAASGTAGYGGNGAKGESWNSPFLSGGDGGRGGSNPTSTQSDSPSAPSTGTEGTEVAETAFSIMTGAPLTLTIVVPAKGLGGNPGHNATGPGASTTSRSAGADGANDGWIRIRTAIAAPAPENLTAGTVQEASIPFSWDAVSNTTKYRIEYRLATAEDWTVDDDTLTTTSHTVDGLTCGTEYQFRVSSYGSGTHYEAAWSDPSTEISATTTACS